MIKALIFDCWGTVFTNTQTPHPFVIFAKKLGYEISDRSFLKQFEQYMMTDDNSVSEHIMSLLIELKIDPANDLVNELADIIFGSLPTQIAYDDTAETLDKLKKNYRLILLSNTFHEGFENLRLHYPIDDWFELVNLSYQEHTIKPDPALYNKILSQSGLNKDEVLMVGDNYHDDILAANKAGIKGILLDRRNRYPEVSEDKVHDLHQLLDLLESM
ncbi:MAG TPA: HAD family hydrolase [Candidatus Microsaccharimonas sp.]|jgi:HAD superfamily hydrolase (TIGR01509 family)